MERLTRLFILLAVVIAASLIFSSTSKSEYSYMVLYSKRESMEKASVKPVLFPHWFHRIRFKCKVCHEDIFILKRGANDINMKAIMSGEFCGRCHNGLTAWEPLYCDRCHSYDAKK
ncbi:MAG: hypothetical protein HY880_06215 [Deltaproteobacteria bacterium]|nr:hypothetical protein [Deltaproteobacteria bacterium]